MKSKRLRLTRGDIRSAIYQRNQDIERFGFPLAIGSICPIFQSLQRSGYDPVVCGSLSAVLKNNKSLGLSERAAYVTAMPSKDWSRLLEESLPIYYTVKYVD